MKSLCLAATLLAAATSARAGTAAPGLVDQQWASGLTQPIGIAFLPGADNSKFLVIEKAGAIKMVDHSLPAPGWTTLGTIGVCTVFEMGLLGIAVFPDYGVTHHVYLYRTENDGGCGAPRGNEVIRVTLDPLLVPGSQTLILGGIRTGAGAHNGGGLRVAPDGTLYISAGDNGLGGNGCPGTNTNLYPQDPNVLEGKVLRINRDGTIPADNPFVGMAGHRAEVFAIGFRNPWRFSFDPVTGRLWMGDVGALAAEELDLVDAGGNYGWPRCEATLPVGCEQTGDVPPIYAYRHDETCPEENTLPPTLGKSITGGSFAGAAFGAFESSWVFGDFAGDAMYLAVPTAARDGIAAGPITIAAPAGRPVDIVTGPDGAVYYTAITTGEIRRIASQSEPLAGKLLRLTTGRSPTGKTVDVRSSDPALTLGLGNGSVDDPVLHGGRLRIRTTQGCSGPCDDSYALANNPPDETWSYVGESGEQKGYRYRSKLSGLRVWLKPGSRLRVKGRGDFGHELAANPQTVDVTFSTGLRRYCLGFGGEQIYRGNDTFRASDAAAPSSCDPIP